MIGVATVVMNKAILIFLSLAALCCTAPTGSGSPEGTNRVADSGAASNNQVQPSDAELQAKAREVWHRLIVFGLLAFLGALVVAGFALYGAYHAFGIRGVVGVGIIVAFGIVVLCAALLLLF